MLTSFSQYETVNDTEHTHTVCRIHFKGDFQLDTNKNQKPCEMTVSAAISQALKCVRLCMRQDRN